MRKAISLAALFCLAAAIAVKGAGVKGRAPADPTTKLVQKTKLEQMIEQLGHPRYRVRKAAEKALSKLDTDALPALLKARKNSTDLEVVRRLDNVIPNLERSALLKPALVTLHISKRPFTEVVAAISKQTGYPIEVQNNPNNDVYTFNFDKIPFWDALDRVSKEAKLSINPNYYYGNSNDRIHLASYGNPPGPYVKYQQAFRLHPTGFNYNRNVSFTGSYYTKESTAQRSESLTMSFMIHAEPKLPFLQVGQATVTRAFDEKNRNMAPPVQTTTSYYYDRSLYSEYGNGTRSYSHSLSVNMIRPTRDSKTAKLIQGEIPVLLLRKQTPEIVIEKPVGVKKKKFQGRRTTIEIESVTPTNWGNGMMYAIQMSIKEDSDVANNDYAWANSLQNRLELFDAKGNKYWVQNSSLYNRGSRLATGTIQFLPPNNVPIGPPVKLVYNQWTSMQHRIKFEFKDLPLP